jgi:hypothetical protein
MAFVSELTYNKFKSTSKCQSSATNNTKMRGYEMLGSEYGGTVSPVRPVCNEDRHKVFLWVEWLCFACAVVWLVVADFDQYIVILATVASTPVLFRSARLLLPSRLRLLHIRLDAFFAFFVLVPGPVAVMGLIKPSSAPFGILTPVLNALMAMIVAFCPFTMGYRLLPKLVLVLAPWSVHIATPQWSIILAPGEERALMTVAVLVGVGAGLLFEYNLQLSTALQAEMQQTAERAQAELAGCAHTACPDQYTSVASSRLPAHVAMHPVREISGTRASD